MVKISDFYEIDADSIEAIVREENEGSKYPYVLKVRTKTGREYAVSFPQKAAREHEIYNIVASIQRAKYGTRVTPDDIHRAAAAEVDKLRPYLRRIEKMLARLCPQDPEKEG